MFGYLIHAIQSMWFKIKMVANIHHLNGGERTHKWERKLPMYFLFSTVKKRYKFYLKFKGRGILQNAKSIEDL